MILRAKKSLPSGSVKIPGSKSHSIRALYFAALADGVSEIYDALDSGDSRSAETVCHALGARIEKSGGNRVVYGFGDRPQAPRQAIDVGNSGTSLRLGVAVASLGDQVVPFTGDAQIQSRPMGPLIHALHNLGAEIQCENHNAMAPLSVRGPLIGGEIELDAVTSQFLSALLIACPVSRGDTRIALTRLNEKPYVELTMWWLDKLGIRYEAQDDLKSFFIPGGQTYRPFKQAIPADFSSATFFMALAAVSGESFFLENLDVTDPQGDKAVLQYLESMGAVVTQKDQGIQIQGGKLTGREIDLNATPDALPAMAVVGCFAEGETALVNVPQARIKETDRIRVMCQELRKMGADVRELSDAMVIRKSRLHGAALSGHRDHRVVMALAVAGLNAEGETLVDTAEAAQITFPGYFEILQACGADIRCVR